MSVDWITDEAVEAAAEAMHALEYPAYSPTAHEDSNRWSWRGDGHGGAYREEYRRNARAAVDALRPFVAAAVAAALNDAADALDKARDADRKERSDRRYDDEPCDDSPHWEWCEDCETEGHDVHDCPGAVTG